MRTRERFTVVVADDETELREAVCALIPWREIGFELVGSASNGLDALQLVEQLQPDLLLTDIQMPFITGVDLAKQVRELQPLTQIAFLSGYDDFEYAQKAIEYNVIRYLLKPIGMAELKAELLAIREKLQKRYASLQPKKSETESWQLTLLSLLLDAGRSEAEEEALRKELLHERILSDGGETSHTVLSIGAHGADNSILRNLAGSVDLILERYFTSHSVYSGGRILTLLSSADNFRELTMALDELLQAMQRVLKLSCVIGVSRPYQKLCRSYIASREATDAQHAADEPGVVRFAELFTQTEAEGADMPRELAELLHNPEREKLDKLLAMLLMPMEQMYSEERDMRVLQILSVVLQALYAAAPAQEVTTLCRRCRITQMLSPNLPAREVQERLNALCHGACSLLSGQRREGVSKLCAQAMDIIDRQYMDEGLSLGAVSELLHVSPNYLSANMKKYAGDTFINLLIKKRMEVASKLLTHGNLKIFEIARQCGYSDQHYFSFCFKKYHGISPAQMRRGDRQKGGAAE